MGKYLIITIAIFVALALIIMASAGSDDLGNIKKLLSSLDDPKMTISDLAFFLATHNYDARPTKDCVELKLNGTVYRLIPGRGDSELCKIIPS